MPSVRSIATPYLIPSWAGPGNMLNLTVINEVDMLQAPNPPVNDFTVVTAQGNFMPAVTSWATARNLYVPVAVFATDPSPIALVYTGDGGGYESTTGLLMNPFATDQVSL